MPVLLQIAWLNVHPDGWVLSRISKTGLPKGNPVFRLVHEPMIRILPRGVL